MNLALETRFFGQTVQRTGLLRKHDSLTRAESQARRRLPLLGLGL